MDIIIDDAFLEGLLPDEKELFSDVYKMIEAMQSLDEEEEELAKNLDGEVVNKHGINGVMKKAQEEPANSESLYEAYFASMMQKTLENFGVGASSA